MLTCLAELLLFISSSIRPSLIIKSEWQSEEGCGICYLLLTDWGESRPRQVQHKDESTS